MPEYRLGESRRDLLQMHTKNGQTFLLSEEFTLKHWLSHSDFHTELISFYLPQKALLKDPATPPNVTSQDCITY